MEESFLELTIRFLLVNSAMAVRLQLHLGYDWLVLMNERHGGVTSRQNLSRQQD